MSWGNVLDTVFVVHSGGQILNIASAIWNKMKATGHQSNLGFSNFSRFLNNGFNGAMRASRQDHITFFSAECNRQLGHSNELGVLIPKGGGT